MVKKKKAVGTVASAAKTASKVTKTANAANTARAVKAAKRAAKEERRTAKMDRRKREKRLYTADMWAIPAPADLTSADWRGQSTSRSIILTTNLLRIPKRRTRNLSSRHVIPDGLQLFC